MSMPASLVVYGVTAAGYLQSKNSTSFGDTTIDSNATMPDVWFFRSKRHVGSAPATCRLPNQKGRQHRRWKKRDPIDSRTRLCHCILLCVLLSRA